MEQQESFTRRAKSVLSNALEEAKRLNHNYIGTEHILLGLVRETDSVAGGALAAVNVSLDKVRSGVEFIIGRGKEPFEGERKLTPRTRHVMDLAAQEARDLGHAYIGTEHILLGLLREGEGIAAGVLESLGANGDRLRAEILSILDRAAAQAGPAQSSARQAIQEKLQTSRENVISVRIGASDLEALDALVEAGVRATRSEAASWLIHAGIEANLDLFDKVYSTVAEIKRLRDAAQELARGLEAKDTKQVRRPAPGNNPPDSGNQQANPQPPAG